MASKMRPRSASLKALPPDSPSSVSNEAPSLAPASLHWTVNSKEKSAGSGKRTLKSVSLKLPKGSEASPTSSRSNSAGLPWGSGELLLDARQCARQGTGSGPPSRGSSGSEAIGHPAYPVPGGSRQPLQPVQPSLDRGQPPAREKLSSTAPAAVGRRPPVPTRPAPGSEGSAAERRKAAGRSAADSLKSAQAEELPSRPGSSYERAASIYASLPATPSGNETLLQDADSFIFKPAIQAEVKPMPKGMRRNPQAAAPSRSRGLAAALSSSKGKPESGSHLQEQVLQLQQKAKQLQARLTARDPAIDQENDEEADLPAPRIAWSEPAGASNEEEFDSLDIAAQIRRDLLSRQLLEEEGEAEQEMEEKFQKRALTTDDAKRSMGELEDSLAKAYQRGERDRLELGSYLEALRSRTFQAPVEDSAFLTGPEEEPLISMPDDFDDVVDINASMAAAERRRGRPTSAEGSQHPTPEADKTSVPESNSATSLRLPSFLEKYFDEDKAAQELPIVKMQLEEARGVKTKDKETELDKGLRQIERLDVLLATREASGIARIKASKVELDAAKERLRQDGEKGEQEKYDLLRKLKEKGMLRSSAPSCATSRAPSEPSHSMVQSASQSRLNSARGSTTSLVATTPTPVSPTGEAKLVDWSGWASTAEEPQKPEPAPSLASLNSLVLRPASREETPAGSVQSTPRRAEDDLDTATFNLTATTADLGSLGAEGKKRRGAAQARTLQPVIEDAVPGEDLGSVPEGDVEELELEEPPLELEDLYAADPYDLDAIRAIDDKLALLVPEQEWEAKSIRSLPMASELGSVTGEEQAKGAKSGRARSVWSHKSADSTLPGEAVLREQAEERETRAALVAINDKLSELQDAPSSRELTPEDLQKLLLQAASQSALPDAQDKVLALTAKEDDLQKSLQGMMKLSGSNSALAIPDQSSLAEARTILDRLANNKDEWETAFNEAEFSLGQVEEGLQSLEEIEARPAIAQDEKAIEAAVAEVNSFAGRLEELGREADLMALGPSQALLQNLADSGTAKGMDGATGVADAPDVDAADSAITALPLLSGAGASLDEEDDLGSDFGDLPAAEGFDEADLTEDLPAPLREPVPAVEPTKALDLELPSADGLWDDAELERVARAMDAHYGDVLQLPPDRVIQEMASDGEQE